MTVPIAIGIKRSYIDHLTFDQTLQPIDEAGAGLIRVDYRENIEGHRSGANANSTQANLSPVYSTFTTTPQKQNWQGEMNRGNPNRY